MSSSVSVLLLLIAVNDFGIYHFDIGQLFYVDYDKIRFLIIIIFTLV